MINLSNLEKRLTALFNLHIIKKIKEVFVKTFVIYISIKSINIKYINHYHDNYIIRTNENKNIILNNIDNYSRFTFKIYNKEYNFEVENENYMKLAEYIDGKACF